MIQLEVQVCIIDNLPIEQSPAYDALCEATDEETAQKWTRFIAVPPDDGP